jgi:hypothetical protein
MIKRSFMIILKFVMMLNIYFELSKCIMLSLLFNFCLSLKNLINFILGIDFYLFFQKLCPFYG